MKNGGSFGAIAGRHDDRVMTRVIALIVMLERTRTIARPGTEAALYKRQLLSRNAY